MIEDIDRACGQVREARGLPAVLAAGLAGFGVLAAGCRAGERGGHELFAAFMFAGAAAAEGRITLAGAGSLPPGSIADGHGVLADVPDGLEELADALARLAQALQERLAGAGRIAGPGDAGACADAAIAAATVRALLARNS